MQGNPGLRFGRYGITALVVCFAVGAFVEDLALPTVTRGSATYDRGPEAVIAVVLLCIIGLVAVRERLGLAAPLAALALLSTSSLAGRSWVLDSSFVFLLAMLLCGLGGYAVRSHIAHGWLLLVWCAGSLAAWRRPDESLAEWFGVVAFMTVAWVTGALIRGPVLRAKSAEELAEHLQQEQEAAAREAVVLERQRLARELHDVIAHSVSVMTVQAGAVRRRLTPEQAKERESLLAVERTGREALAEMRRLVGLLKDDEEGASYAPQPGLASIDGLLVNVSAAGLEADLATEGAARPLPPGIELAAYRIVQEALTNALKHGGPGRAHVRLTWSDDELLVEVTNNGRAVSGRAAEQSGHGLVGMRERLRLYGGRLDAGPDGTGYAVRASVPIGPAA